jgi:hypothetical protein
MAHVNGVIPSQPDARDAVLDHLLNTNYKSAVDDFKTVDLSTRLPPATFNQGANPVCVSHSVAVLMMWLLKIPDLSSTFIYQLRENCTQNVGMSFKDALSIVHTYGIPRISDYPDSEPIYINSEKVDPSKRLPLTVMAQAAKNKLLAYGTLYSLQTVLDVLDLADAYAKTTERTGGVSMQNNMSSSSSSSSAPLVSNVAAIGPILIVIPVYSTGSSEMTPWKASRAGQQQLGFHAVQVTGYNAQRKSLSLRNEWANVPIRNFLEMPFADWIYVADRWFGTMDTPLVTSITAYILQQTAWTNYQPAISGGFLDNDQVAISSSNSNVTESVVVNTSSVNVHPEQKKIENPILFAFDAVMTFVQQIKFSKH